jgi:phage baseplate assembly protein V
MNIAKLAKKTGQAMRDLGDTVRQAFRGRLTLVQSGEPIQRVQLSGLADETLQELELMQHFGFTSHPPPGTEAIVMPLGGNTSHGIVIATENGRLRIVNLAPGETAIYSDEGAKVVIKKGRIIEADCDVYRVNCQQYEINASAGANFNTPKVEASAVVTAQGQINGNGGMAVEGGSGATFKGDVQQTGGSYTTDGDVVAKGKSLATHPHIDSIGGTTSPPL